MSGILPYTLSDTRYLDCEWQSPGMDSVDPLKETKAWISAVEAQIRSPQDIIRASGRDPEAVLQEIQQWQKWREEYGIQDPVMPSTASANNPEAVEEQE
jgi:capsid protein